MIWYNMSLVSEKKLLENTHQLADNHEKLTRGVFCINVFQYLHVSSSQTYVTDVTGNQSYI